MASSFDGSGLAQLALDLDSLADLNPLPVLESWAEIITEGNRRGVLSGLDGNDVPAPPLKYRNGVGRPTRNRRVPNFGSTRFETPGGAGIGQNLTSSEYRQLTGPRLAPRGEKSRIITALHTAINHDPGTGRWEVSGAWADVVNRQGRQFLQFHFQGAGHNPKYDLTLVRPRDRQFCLNALDAWVKQLFREAF